MFHRVIHLLLLFWFSGIPESTVSKLQKDFEKDPKNILAQNVFTQDEPLNFLLKRKTVQDLSHVFSHKVKSVTRLLS